MGVPVRVWPRAPQKIMKKFFILFTLFFLISCSESAKEERYFANCVKDAMKTKKWSEKVSVTSCENKKRWYPDEFSYYKGKIYSKKR